MNTGNSTLIAHIKKKHLHLAPELKQASFDELNALPLSASHQNFVDEALLSWIIEQFQPFMVVDSEAFKEFVSTLNPKYEINHFILVMQTNKQFAIFNAGIAFLSATLSAAVS